MLAVGLGLLGCGEVTRAGGDPPADAPQHGDALDGSQPADSHTPADATPLCVAPNNPPSTTWRIVLFHDADGHSGPDNSCPNVGKSMTSTNPQDVWCRRWGGEVRDAAGNFNHWWLWTELDTGGDGWIAAYYIQGEGNDQANDSQSGQAIADCPP